MNSKTKIILSICALCLVSVVAVVAIVAVYTASKQSLTSNITVEYKATQVVGTAKANYYLGTATAQKMMSGAKDSVDFTAGQTSETGSLSPSGTITITDDQHPYVIFEYIFQNTGEQAFNATLTFSGSPSNIDVYTFYQAEQYTTTSTWTTEKGTKYEGDNNTYFSNVSVATSTTQYFYVVFNIPNVGSDASFSGAFSWSLNAVHA